MFKQWLVLHMALDDFLNHFDLSSWTCVNFWNPMLRNILWAFIWHYGIINKVLLLSQSFYFWAGIAFIIWHGVRWRLYLNLVIRVESRFVFQILIVWLIYLFPLNVVNASFTIILFLTKINLVKILINFISFRLHKHWWIYLCYRFVFIVHFPTLN